MLRILINGLTTQTDALVAAKLGANGLGFILDPEDERYIEFTLANQIISQLPPMVVPYVTPDSWNLEYLQTLAAKLTAGSLIIPVTEYSNDFHTLPCSPTLTGSSEQIRDFLQQTGRRYNCLITDLGLSKLPELEQHDLHLWKQLNQEHSLLLPCDVEPDVLLHHLDIMQPSALYFQGASESHTGLQNFPKLQRYVQTIQEIVERV